MAYNVRFLKGLAADYAALQTKDSNVFYNTTDDGQLYLGTIKLSNANEIVAAVERIADNEQAIVDINTILTKIQGEATVDGSIKKAVADAEARLNAKIGDLEGLDTTKKGNLVEAINEVLTAVGTGGTNSIVTMTSDITTDGALKSYTIKQGTTTVGTIDIPKDMVVKSGAVEVDPLGQPAGTYIVLTLANATEDKVYVNVGTLVDIYKAQASAAQVQLAIDSATREISATIVAESITAIELASNSVITAKIADGNVTKVKLSEGVQASLGKADTAVQSIVEGTTNGTIAVDGVDVAVKGLGSAAYKDASAFDESGAAATAKTEAISAAASDAKSKADAALEAAKAYADEKAGEGLKASDFTTGTTNGTFAVKGTEVAIKGLGSAAYANAADFDGAGSASAAQVAAEATAKKYTDDTIAGLDADVTSAAVEAGKGIQVQVVEVDGKVTSVAVTGNYNEAYDAKGAAAQALEDAKSDAASKDVALKAEIKTAYEAYADQAEVDAKAYADGLAGNYDSAGSASAAETAAKGYTDEALTWGTIA